MFAHKIINFTQCFGREKSGDFIHCTGSDSVWKISNQHFISFKHSINYIFFLLFYGLVCQDTFRQPSVGIGNRVVLFQSFRSLKSVHFSHQVLHHSFTRFRRQFVAHIFGTLHTHGKFIDHILCFIPPVSAISLFNKVRCKCVQ